MIRIVSGTYGYRNPDTNQVEAKTVKSKPFSLSFEREEELVNNGVAEYVKTGCDTEGNRSDREIGMAESPDEETDAGIGDGIPRYNIRDTVERLTAIANQLGIEVGEDMRKKDIIEAIDRKLAADDSMEGEEEGNGDGGPVPEPSAFMPE